MVFLESEDFVVWHGVTVVMMGRISWWGSSDLEAVVGVV